MRSRHVILASLAFAIVAAACSAGGSPPASTPPSPAATSSATLAGTASPSPSPSSSTLVLKLFVDNDPKWSTNTLSAPAGEAFQIALKVTAEDTHNVWIVSASQLETERAAIIDRSGSALFRGDDFRHGTTTYDIPALPAGTYFYVCTYHLASMKGTLTVH